MSVQNFMLIQPMVVETLHPGPKWGTVTMVKKSTRIGETLQQL